MRRGESEEKLYGEGSVISYQIRIRTRRLVVGFATSEGEVVNGWILRVTGPGTMRDELRLFL